MSESGLYQSLGLGEIVRLAGYAEELLQKFTDNIKPSPLPLGWIG
jgi:hypothetical protein